MKKVTFFIFKLNKKVEKMVNFAMRDTYYIRSFRGGCFYPQKPSKTPKIDILGF